MDAPRPAENPHRPDVDWHETPSLRALREMVAAASRVTHSVARRARLSPTELTTLEHLSREQIGPAEVARRLEVSTAAATGIVDRLVSRGHVERRANADDRRRTDLHITPSGWEEISGHLRPMFLGLERNDAEFTDDEREVVRRYLRGAQAAFESVTGPAPGRGEGTSSSPATR